MQPFCIETGFDPKTLSELLGHADASITLNRYVHSSVHAVNFKNSRLCIGKETERHLCPSSSEVMEEVQVQTEAAVFRKRCQSIKPNLEKIKVYARDGLTTTELQV